MGISQGNVLTGAAFGDNSQALGSGWQPLPLGTIRELNSNLFTTKDAYRVQVLTDGLYMIDCDVVRSDLPANQKFIVAYNINDDSAQNHEYEIIQGQYGWNQTGGPNLSRIGFGFHTMQRLKANDYIYYYVATDDGPRSYWYNWRFIKVSD